MIFLLAVTMIVRESDLTGRLGSVWAIHSKISFLITSLGRNEEEVEFEFFNRSPKNVSKRQCIFIIG